jgi:hypothetical protein
MRELGIRVSGVRQILLKQRISSGALKILLPTHPSLKLLQQPLNLRQMQVPVMQQRPPVQATQQRYVNPV